MRSIIAPSSCYMWFNCWASIKMQKDIKEPPESQGSKEGNACHDLAFKVLRGLTRPDLETHIGAKSSNGVVFTEELVQLTKVYVTYVVDYLNSKHGGLEFAMEDQVSDTSIHPKFFGTTDFWGYRDKVVDIVDFKTGRRDTQAKNNLQLICYAFSVISRLKGQPINRINLTIVQPRSVHSKNLIKTWSIDLDELMSYKPKLMQSAIMAYKGSDKATTGNWCNDCLALLTCSTAQNAQMNGFNICEKTAHNSLSNKQLAKELSVLKEVNHFIKSRLEAVETEALIRIKKGKYLPGWGLSIGKGKKEWSKPTKKIIEIGKAFEVDLISKVRTPTQAIAKGIPKEIVDIYSNYRSGNLKIVPDDGTEAQEIFKDE